MKNIEELEGKVQEIAIITIGMSMEFLLLLLSIHLNLRATRAFMSMAIGVALIGMIILVSKLLRAIKDIKKNPEG